MHFVGTIQSNPIQLFTLFELFYSISIHLFSKYQTDDQQSLESLLFAYHYRQLFLYYLWKSNPNSKTFFFMIHYFYRTAT